MHYLVYQTISTPDGLMFCLFRPIELRKHYLTLLRHIQWEDVLANCFHIKHHQFYIFLGTMHIYYDLG